MKILSRKREAAPAAETTEQVQHSAAPAVETKTERQLATPEVNRLASDEGKALQLLKDARELRADLLLKLNAGQDRHDEIETVDSEIAQLTRKLARIAEARKADAARNTKAAKAARYAAMRASLQSAIDTARELGKLSTGLVTLFDEVRTQLLVIAEKKEAIRAHMSAGITESGIEKQSMARHEEMRFLLRELTVPDQFHRALYAAGVGRVGVELEPQFYELKAFSGLLEDAGKREPEKVVNDAVENLKKMANTALRALQAGL